MLYELKDHEMEILLESGGFTVNKKYEGLSYNGVELEHDYYWWRGRSDVCYRLASPDAARLLFMGEDGIKLDDALDRFLDDLEKSLEVVEGGKVQINNKDSLRRSLWSLLK